MKLNPILRNSLRKIVRKIKSYIADYYVPLDEDKKVYWGCMPPSIGDWDESDINSPSHILHRTHYKGPVLDPGFTTTVQTSSYMNPTVYSEGGQVIGIGSYRKFVKGAKYKITLIPLEGQTVPDWAGEYIAEAEDLSAPTDSERLGVKIYGGKLQIYSKYNTFLPNSTNFFIKGKDTWETSSLDCSIKVEVDESYNLALENVSIGTTTDNFFPEGESYPVCPAIQLLAKKFYDVTLDGTTYENIMLNKVTPKNKTYSIGGTDIAATGDYVLCSSGDMEGENDFVIEYQSSTGIFTKATAASALSDVEFSIKCSGIQIIKYLDEYWLTGKLLPEGSGENSTVFNSAIDAVGKNSNAEGTSIAYGTGSHAEGLNTVAYGDGSHSEGGYEWITQIQITHGDYNQYTAAGDYERYNGCCVYFDKLYQIGSAIYDSTTGLTTFNIYNLSKDGTFNVNVFTSIASGMYSHSEGMNCIAAGQATHAEGYGTRSEGYYSHAEGDSSVANGYYGAHSEGSKTLASGNYGSHAEGNETVASGGNGAHSEGSKTLAEGLSSHAEGIGTIARKAAEHVSGMYNEEDSEAYELPYPNWVSNQPYSVGDIVVRYGTDVYECIQDTTGTTWMDTRYWKKLYSVPSGLGKYAEVIGNGFSDSMRSNARRLDWHGNEELAGNLTVNGAMFGMKKPISTTVCNPDTYYCPTTALSVGDLELDETGFNGDYNYMFSGYFTNDDMQGMPQTVKNDDVVSPDTPASITWYGDSGLDAGAEYMFCCTKVASNKYVGVVTKLT